MRDLVVGVEDEPPGATPWVWLGVPVALLVLLLTVEVVGIRAAGVVAAMGVMVFAAFVLANTTYPRSLTTATSNSARSTFLSVHRLCHNQHHQHNLHRHHDSKHHIRQSSHNHHNRYRDYRIHHRSHDSQLYGLLQQLHHHSHRERQSHRRLRQLRYHKLPN